MDNPFFTIITPTFNRAHCIGQAIQCVIDQDFQSWEMIIVDDGSTDDTKEVIKKFKDSRIRYIYQSHNERSAARNNGINHSKGKYLCFLDSDDVFLNNHLQIFYDKLQIIEVDDMIIHSGQIMQNGEKLTKQNLYCSKKYQSPLHFFINENCGVYDFVFPKKLFKDVLFPEQFNYYEDKHFLFRALGSYPCIGIDVYTHIYNATRNLSIEWYSKNFQFIIIQAVEAIDDLQKNYKNIWFGQLKNSDFQKMKATIHLHAGSQLLLLKLKKQSLIEILTAFKISVSPKMLLRYINFLLYYFNIRKFK